MKGFERKLRAWASRLDACGAEAVLASARRGASLAREYVPVDSGELRSSICAEGCGRCSARVAARAKHAAAVEYGTSRMQPRPYLLPMAGSMRAEFIRACAQKLREVFEA